MGIAKSILSVLGSYALSVVLVWATDPLLAALFPNDYKKGQMIPDGLLWLSIALFTVVSILCAWVCAKLAPSKVRTHVLTFFALGEIMGLVFTVVGWDKTPQEMPHWCSITWLLGWIPAVWIGWKLAGRPPAEQ
jgi:hypothetical protein